MAVKTTLAQLEEVQAAITKVMNAQAGSEGDRQIQRARLRELTERETLLLDRYKAEQGTGGPVVTVAVPRRP